MNVNLAESVAKKEGYKKVVCRLCGQEWWYPAKLAVQFNSENGKRGGILNERDTIPR